MVVGKVVVVSCRDGAVWEGLMMAKDPAVGRGHAADERSEPSRPRKTLSIAAADVVSVTVLHGGQERDLVKWDDADSAPMAGGDLAANADGKWDQFEANQKFGYQSTYNEDCYTTKLDKSKLSDAQQDHAARLASKIEGRQGGGGHRDHAAWADDFDEEALHSAYRHAMARHQRA
eukprot:gene141-47709_t